MKIKIEAYKSPASRLNNNEPKSMHPRIISPHTVRSNDIAMQIQNACTLTQVDIQAVLSALAESIASNLTAGHSIQLDGIGTLSIVPAFSKPIYEGDRYTGADVEVKQINFTPDHQLLKTVRFESRFEKGHTTHSPQISLGDAFLLISKYLQEHESVDSETAMKLLSTKRDKTYRLLRELVNRNKLVLNKVHGINYYALHPSQA